MFKNVAFGRNQRSREYRLPSCKIGHKDVPSPIVPPFPRSAFLHFTGYSHISLLLKVRREQSFTVLGLQLHGERTMSPEKRFSSCVRCPTVREGEQQCNSVPLLLSWLSLLALVLRMLLRLLLWFQFSISLFLDVP